MGSKRGALTGIFSGGMQGAGTGFELGGPVGAGIGALTGGIIGGITGNQEDELTDEELAQLEAERRRQEMESGFSHLMSLQQAKQQERNQGMNTLNFLAGQRGVAAQNAKRRLLRETILS